MASPSLRFARPTTPVVGHLAALVAVVLLSACGQGATGVDEDTGGFLTDTGGGDADASDDTGGEDAREDIDPNACRDFDNDGYGPNCDLGPDCNDEHPEVNPGAPEICGDAFDNDCDGQSDEDCICAHGTTSECFDGDPENAGVGVCQMGQQVCEEGVWSDCNNRTPRDEICDGNDNDCDGEDDEGVTNDCGTCGPVPLEICGDFLDNDCNGVIDDAADCNCGERQSQPCYSGQVRTLGFGICRGGIANCVDGAVVECVGEVLPGIEICDGIDNDCDGEVDETLANSCGECGAEDPVEECNGIDDDCDGDVDEGLLNLCGTCGPIATPEVCGDGMDNNCDGTIDEGCLCFEGDEFCWPGLPEQRGVGACEDGERQCDASGEFWGICTGFTLPTTEVCDGIDNDCDGLIDNGRDGCSVCGTDFETCDGLDNDCDGQIDETLRNACGQCLDEVATEEACGPTCCDGVDNDCDGLVDEGLVNVCGSCSQTCFIESWGAEPEEWEEGEFAGTELDLDGHLRLGDDFTGLPYMWVPNSGEGTVSKIDTDTQTEVARYPAGEGPSRSAVDFDGNVFVVNRAFFSQSTITRINGRECEGADCVRFNAPVGGNNAVARGVAIDEEGFPWVGTYNDTALRRVDPVTGITLEEYDVGYPIFGIAIDAEGIVWFTSIEIPEYEHGHLGAFDIATRSVIGTWEVPGCSNPYGIAIDPDGMVWMSNFVCNNLVRYDRRADRFDTWSVGSWDRMRGVAVDADDKIWIVSYGSDQVSRFDPLTGSFIGSYNVCDAPIGLGMTADRHVYVVCYGSDTVQRLNYAGQVLDTINVGRDPYSFGDITGFSLRNFNSRRGRWTVEFDCGRTNCSFGEVTWDADIPDEGEIQVRARVSNDGETWSPWAGPFIINPANLGGLPPAQYVQIELLLRTSNREFSPIVDLVELSWAYP